MANIEYLKNLIGKDVYKSIEDLYLQTDNSKEFELIINNTENKYFGQDKYIQLLKYLKYKATALKTNILTVDILDIIYAPTNEEIFRVSLVGDNINEYIKKLDLWKSHIIFKTLVRINEQKSDKSIKVEKKIKTKENLIVVEDLFERFRLSGEVNLSKEDYEQIHKITHEDMDKITFRLKQRTSLDIYNKDDEFVKIDLTTTKNTKNYKHLNTTYPNYELEIEYGLKSGKPNKAALEILLNESIILHKIIQQSNYLITKSMTNKVITYYRNIANVDENSTFLDTRQSVSLEIQYLTENIPNKYAVTDKADGDRYFLIIMNSRVYFISTNLVVKDSGIELKTKDYDGTILDGEYIFISNLNRHLFLIFDALFIGSKDIRMEVEFMKRIKEADILCNKIFVFDKQKGYKINEYKTDKTFDLGDILSHHKKEITKLMKNINEDMKYEKQYPLIRTKYFADATGAAPWEIFAYAEQMYKLYTEDEEVNCPYLLDGLIFQPLQQQYITKMSESKLVEYKWKPPTKNSIDFYIQFEKDPTTNKILNVYDNSNDDYVRNKAYRICKLYVGRWANNKETPEIFLEDKNIYWAYLFLENGEARDIEGNIIMDNTVVEFYYENSQGEDVVVPEKFRWKPLRTRYDKTESVLRFGRKYGNNADIAFKIWRSIQNPILVSDFNDLAKGNIPDKNKFYYDYKIEQLRTRIGHELIVSASKQNAYYQKITNLAKPMREFHNWIKSNIMYTYLNKQYNDEKPVSVLDLGVGRGGDILRYYYVNAAFVVGIDIAKEGLYSAVDGAISRYNQQRKRKPNFPRMYFIHGDCGTKLTYEEQNRVLGGMNFENKKLITQFFGNNPTKFDRLNSQFTIHYFLANKTVWSNFKYNINQTLRPGGIFVIAHLDANKIVSLIGNKNNYEKIYTDDKGRTEKLYELVKKFDKLEKPIGIGNAIDLYAAWMFESGTYQTEYLVDVDFLKEDLLKDCNLELIETDLFENQYNMHKDFFLETYKYQCNPQTLQYLEKVSHYYEDTEINKACLDYTFLHRYSIFRKKDGNADAKVSRPVSNKYINNMSYDETEEGITEFKPSINVSKLSKSKFNQEYSFMNSIYYILSQHKIIPKTITVEEFYKDNKIKMIKDADLTAAKMKSITKDLNISHEIENGKSYNVIEGLNIDIYEKDKLSRLVNNKKDKTVLLTQTESGYQPVFVTNMKDKKQSLFNIDDSLIKNLY